MIPGLIEIAMIAVAGLGAVAATMAIVANWEEVKKWFRDFTKALFGIFTTTIKGVSHAAGAFAKVMREGITGIMHKLLYQEGNHYVEEIRTRELEEDKLPAWAKKKLKQAQASPEKEADITEETEQELKMTL